MTRVSLKRRDSSTIKTMMAMIAATAKQQNKRNSVDFIFSLKNSAKDAAQYVFSENISLYIGLLLDFPLKKLYHQTGVKARLLHIFYRYV